jgi:hypothetical protein
MQQENILDELANMQRPLSSTISIKRTPKLGTVAENLDTILAWSRPPLKGMNQSLSPFCC